MFLRSDEVEGYWWQFHTMNWMVRYFHFPTCYSVGICSLLELLIVYRVWKQKYIVHILCKSCILTPLQVEFGASLLITGRAIEAIKKQMIVQWNIS